MSCPLQGHSSLKRLRKAHDVWRKHNLISNFLGNWIIRTSKFNLSYSVKDVHMIQDLSPLFFVTEIQFPFSLLYPSKLRICNFFCFQSLCQWILSVKKNYRKNVAYHNWRHAFNTSQCMFAILKSGRLQVSAGHSSLKVKALGNLLLRFIVTWNKAVTVSDTC